MEAKELRIGNLVLTKTVTMDMYGTEFGQVETEVKGITATGINPYVFKGAYVADIRDMHSFVNLKPIPLTEEWLIKLGFRLSRDWYDYPLNYSLEYHPKEKLLVIWPEDSHGGGDMDRVNIPCEFVHHLQNIIHALTGEELTIKEPVK